MPSPTSSPERQSVGKYFVCRREVFDVLSAADGSLPFQDLLDRVGPRLHKYVLKEIQNEGGVDPYLRKRLAYFREADGIQKPMISWDEAGPVRLRPRFRLRVDEDGTAYVPGTQAAQEEMERWSQRIADSRRAGRWDALVPQGSVEDLRDQVNRVGFLPGQNYEEDSSGYLIDGRARLQVQAEMNPKVKFGRARQRNDLRLPIAHGIVYAYHVNRSRMTTQQRRSYRARLLREIGMDLAVAERHFLLTYDLVLTSRAAIKKEDRYGFSVEGKPVTVTLDVSKEWVKVATLLAMGGAPNYEGKRIREAFEECGLEIRFGPMKSIWIRARDIERFYSIQPDGFGAGARKPEAIEQWGRFNKFVLRFYYQWVAGNFALVQ